MTTTLLSRPATDPASIAYINDGLQRARNHFDPQRAERIRAREFLRECRVLALRDATLGKPRRKNDQKLLLEMLTIGMMLGTTEIVMSVRMAANLLGKPRALGTASRAQHRLEAAGWHRRKTPQRRSPYNASSREAWQAGTLKLLADTFEITIPKVERIGKTNTLDDGEVLGTALPKRSTFAESSVQPERRRRRSSRRIS